MGFISTITSFFSTYAIKILLVVSLVLFVSSTTFFKLYLSTQKDLASLETSYKQLLVDVDDMKKNHEKSKASCQVNDTVTVALDTKVKVIEDKKESVLKKIDDIPKKSCIDKSTTKEQKDEEIDIDAELPASIDSVLTESFNKK